MHHLYNDFLFLNTKVWLAEKQDIAIKIKLYINSEVKAFKKNSFKRTLGRVSLTKMKSNKEKIEEEM